MSPLACDTTCVKMFFTFRAGAQNPLSTHNFEGWFLKREMSERRRKCFGSSVILGSVLLNWRTCSADATELTSAGCWVKLCFKILLIGIHISSDRVHSNPI